jgi:hypothetical protein
VAELPCFATAFAADRAEAVDRLPTNPSQEVVDIIREHAWLENRVKELRAELADRPTSMSDVQFSLAVIELNAYVTLVSVVELRLRARTGGM